MARVAGPLDVSQTPLRNMRRVVEVQADTGSAEAMATIGSAATQILNQARDRQIENDVAKAEIRVRRELDELRVALDKYPDNETLQQRWETGANEIMTRNAETLRSPAHQRMWQERTARALEGERRSIVELQQQRFVAAALGGTIEVISDAERSLTDPNASPQTRDSAMQVIETTVARAIEQRVLTSAQGAEQIARARDARAEFDRTQGIIQSSTTQAQEIVSASRGSLSRALDAVRALPPGVLRDRTEDRVLEYYNQQEVIRARSERIENEATDNAMERARVAVDEGTAISESDRSLLVRRGLWDEVQNARALSGPGGGGRLPPTASRVARDTILGWARDPNGGAQRFAGLDLRAPLTSEQAAAFGLDGGVSLLSQLQGEDFNALRDVQIGEGEDSAVQDVYSRILEYAEIVAMRPENGSFDAGSDRQADAPTVNRFRAFIHREAEAFAESGRELTQADIQRITTLALTRVRFNGFMGLGGRDAYVFQAGENNNTINVPVSRIPIYQRERILLDYYRNDPSATRLDDEAAERLIEQRYNAEINAREQSGGVRF